MQLLYLHTDNNEHLTLIYITAILKYKFEPELRVLGFKISYNKTYQISFLPKVVLLAPRLYGKSLITDHLYILVKFSRKITQ